MQHSKKTLFFPSSNQDPRSIPKIHVLQLTSFERGTKNCVRTSSPDLQINNTSAAGSRIGRNNWINTWSFTYLCMCKDPIVLLYTHSSLRMYFAPIQPWHVYSVICDLVCRYIILLLAIATGYIYVYLPAYTMISRHINVIVDRVSQH